MLLVGGIAAAVLLVVLFALLRPSDDETAATTTVSTPAASTVAPTTTAPTGGTTTGSVELIAITVEVAGGTPVGGIRRATVQKGMRVNLRVTGAPGEELHLHGYDETLELGADGAGTLAFEATLQGVFEVELERAGISIAELTVR